MAEISKLSGVAIANVAKVDAVTKANIANINDLTIPSAAAFLLDTYPATAAYSLRKLKTGVTVAARIRRSGDDIEADVEFDTNDEISLSSPISNASSGTYTDLADFVDHTGTARDAFIDEWKDQSGNSYHAAQATAGSQPKLYDATTGLITENGKPALDFDGSNDELVFDWPSSSGSQIWQEDWATFSAVAVDASGPVYGIQQGGSLTTRMSQYYQVGNTLVWFRNNPGSAQIHNSTNLVAGHYLLTTTSEYTSTSDRDHTGYIDGTQIATVNDTSTYENNSFGTNYYYRLRIGGQYTQYLNGRFQELVMYANDQTSNRTGIETDINDHYLIGNFPNPTSGLLYDYSGAAAAYSVRQLANTAALAMRIREDGTDTETDIGFDANGDLDTAAISSHCGSNNGYVVTWYDQAGSQVDATQGTSGSQPQIYNGTAVLSDNGKPTVKYTLGDKLTAPSVSTGQEDRSIYIVYHADSVGVTNNIADLTDSQSGATGSRYSITTEVGVRCYVTTYVPGGGTSDQTLFAIEQDISETPNLHLYTNNTEIGTGGTINDNVVSGSTLIGSSSQRDYAGNLQEVIIYISDQSANRSGIQTNINGYFSIYT